MPIKEKYNSQFAQDYREKLAAECEGKVWSRSSSASKLPLRKMPSSASVGGGINSNDGNGNRSSNNSPAYLTNSPTVKQQKDAYFEKKQMENASRPDDLPPSQGGKYAGFGNTPQASSSYSSQQIRIGNDDIFSALTSGLSYVTSVVGEGARLALASAENLGQKINENVIVPTAAAVREIDTSKVTSNISSYFQQSTVNGSSGSPRASPSAMARRNYGSNTPTSNSEDRPSGSPNLSGSRLNLSGATKPKSRTNTEENWGDWS